jgi:tRNA G18 (ribose-2'-O)-methylase SpoU
MARAPRAGIPNIASGPGISGVAGMPDAPFTSPRVVRIRSANNAFQHAEVLKRNRYKRHRFGEFFVEGVKAINQALAHGWTVTTLIYSTERSLSGWAKQIIAGSRAETHLDLAPHLMEQLSDKQEPSELLALVRTPEDHLTRIAPTQPMLVVVFDRPSSPGNLGALIRSCDALGADGLVVTGHGADVYAPETIRASVGSLFALPVVRRESHRDLAAWFPALAKAAGAFQVVGASGDAETPVDAHDFSVPTVLILGNETYGLSAAYRELCDTLVRIPMRGNADSLNVACAASIVLYEIDRQRRTAPR